MVLRNIFQRCAFEIHFLQHYCYIYETKLNSYIYVHVCLHMFFYFFSNLILIWVGIISVRKNKTLPDKWFSLAVFLSDLVMSHPVKVLWPVHMIPCTKIARKNPSGMLCEELIKSNHIRMMVLSKHIISSKLSDWNLRKINEIK